jgi:hypothetical protein
MATIAFTVVNTDSPECTGIRNIIYIARNKINHKVYIGQTTKTLGKRKGNHAWDAFKHNSPWYFHRALRKYGMDNFEWGILEQVEGGYDELNKKEDRWVKLFDSRNPEKGYNQKDGGFNSAPTENAIRLCRERCSIPIYCHQNGKSYASLTEAAKEFNVSNSLLSQFLNGSGTHAKGYTFEYVDPNKDYSSLPLLERIKPKRNTLPVYCHQTGISYKSMGETERRLSLGKGNVISYFNQKTSHAGGYTFEIVEDENKYPLPLRSKINTNAGKPVVCVETGIEYPSVREAARQTGISRDIIYNCVSGRYLNTLCGKTFKYKRGFYYEQRKSIPVIHLNTGIEYPSIREASRQLCINKSTLTKCLRGGTEFNGHKFAWKRDLGKN